jgi:diadenosine tetraphosphate (Ap4A) HIT family hydrolase
MSDCPFCAVEAAVDAAPTRETAHLTQHWRLTAHRSALPGWMLLIPRRHVRSISELDDAAAAQLGPLLRAPSRVHLAEFGAEKTYVMQFAEGVAHAHFSLVPRRADLPADRRGPAVSAYNTVNEPLGDAERDALTLRIRAAWPAA